MKINPILPIWLMAIICIVALVIRRRNKFAYIRQVCMIVLLFLVNLRIMIPNSDVPVLDKELNAYVIFVVDDTISILAQDGRDGGTRLDDVKMDCERIVDELNGARFSVITFNNATNISCPFTNNSNHVKSVINSIYPISSYNAKGTSLNTPIDVMKTMIDRAEDKDGKVIVFFISDGEVTNGEEVTSFAELSKDIMNGLVLGYGTSKGAKMEIEDYDYGLVTKQTVKDYSSVPYQDAISKMDEDNLKKIASDLEIQYVNMTNDSDISSEIQSIRKSLDEKNKEGTRKGYGETYFLFVIPFVLLVIYEYIDIKRKGGLN